ncbi:MAG: alpha-L-fucosidase, partial [Cyclobacteriaceae bacterium]
MATSLMINSCNSVNTEKDSQGTDSSLHSSEDRLQWFRQAKFGMFIHWGIYSVPGGEYKDGKDYAEWIWMKSGMPSEEYVAFAEEFNPVKFNADEWAQLASDAGMSYMVFTAKHHDGFCMYDSKLTDF